MKKLLVTLLLLPSVALAHNGAIEEFLGSRLAARNMDLNCSEFNLDAADGADADSCSDDMMAQPIWIPATCTIDKLRAHINTVTGSLGASDIHAVLYAGAAGVPTGSAIADYSTLTSAAANDTWIEWAGFNDVVNQNTQMFIVFQNCNATPGTNYPRFCKNLSSSHAIPTDPLSAAGMAGRCTSDGGSTWTGCTLYQPTPFVVECAEGYSFGYPYQGGGYASQGTNNASYGTTEAGAVFTTPPDAKIRAIGISCHTAKRGTPPGAMSFKLYKGTDLVTTTDSMAASDISTSNYARTLYFDSVQTLDANTVYRVSVAGPGAGGGASNCYALGYTDIDNDTESLTLRPFGGTMRMSYYNGSTWTEVETAVPGCSLVLDNGDYFGTQSTGSSNRSSGINGGLN